MDFAALGEAQAAAEKEKNRQKKEMESLQQVRDHARKIRQSRVHTEKSQDKNNTKTKNEADGTTNNKNHVDMMHGADWTTTYRHFDDWEDPEELAAEAEVSYREENVFFFLLNNNDNNNKKKILLLSIVCSCSFSFSCSVCVLPISVVLFQIYFCINMQALEKKRKSERERQPTSCNHDHAAERKVYEMDWHER